MGPKYSSFKSTSAIVNQLRVSSRAQRGTLVLAPQLLPPTPGVATVGKHQDPSRRSGDSASVCLIPEIASSVTLVPWQLLRNRVADFILFKSLSQSIEPQVNHRRGVKRQQLTEN